MLASEYRKALNVPPVAFAWASSRMFSNTQACIYHSDSVNLSSKEGGFYLQIQLIINVQGSTSGSSLSTPLQQHTRIVCWLVIFGSLILDIVTLLLLPKKLRSAVLGNESRTQLAVDAFTDFWAGYSNAVEPRENHNAATKD